MQWVGWLGVQAPGPSAWSTTPPDLQELLDLPDDEFLKIGRQADEATRWADRGGRYVASDTARWGEPSRSSQMLGGQVVWAGPTRAGEDVHSAPRRSRRALEEPPAWIQKHAAEQAASSSAGPGPGGSASSGGERRGRSSSSSKRWW